MATSSSTATNKYMQAIAYIKRNPSLTLPQFYDYWQNVHAKKVAPWAEKHGVVSYRQVHFPGCVVPNRGTNSAPITPSSGEPTQSTEKAVEYDGMLLVVWELRSLEQFQKAYRDPYYLNIIVPDEYHLIDKNGIGEGIVAAFAGNVVIVLEGGRSTVGAFGKEERKVWEEWETKTEKDLRESELKLGMDVDMDVESGSIN